MSAKATRVPAMMALVAAGLLGGVLSPVSAGAGILLPADPGSLGPYTVASVNYSLPSTTVAAYGTFPVYFAGEITYPTDAPGPSPLVIINHGANPSCYDPKTLDMSRYWPCSADPSDPNTVPLPSYAGFDYLARALAAQGFIVDAVAANTLYATYRLPLPTPGADDADADLTLETLDQWRDVWAATPDRGPGGVDFDGKVDLTRIGLLGHSAGAYGSLLTPAANSRRAPADRYRIGAIMAIGSPDPGLPVDDVPLALVEPYCDANVPDLAGVRVFDESRFNDPTDPTPKYLITVEGANHFWWSTVQVASDPYPPGLPLFGDDSTDPPANPADSACGYTSEGASLVSSRLTQAAQRQVLVTYAAAFFRLTLDNETDLAPLFTTGDVNTPPSVGRAVIRVTDQPPAGQRLVVNAFTKLRADALGGRVTWKGFTNGPTLCGTTTPCVKPAIGPPYSQQPDYPAVTAVELRWNSPAVLTDSFPSHNISRFARLQFRGGMNVSALTQPSPVFAVTLGDAHGHSATVSTAKLTTALDRPGGDGPTATYPDNPVPRTLLQTVRVPLTNFTAANPHLDLSHITSLRLVFDGRGGTSNGDIVVTDMMFAYPATAPSPARPSASTPGSGPDDTPYAVSALSVAIIVILVAVGLRRRRRSVRP